MPSWNWKQPSGKTLRVISDYEKGTIHVYDENDKLVLEKKNLSKDVIKMVESNFLNIVAANDNQKKLDDDNPMYV
jgi:hypothetical protein